MRVSLKLIKKYVDLPKELTYKQIADDLTLRTVEVPVQDTPNFRDGSACSSSGSERH